MKKMRKIFAVLLTLAMVLGMSMTSFAANSGTDNIFGTADDTATITVNGINNETGIQVNAYKVVEAKYDGAGHTFSGYNSLYPSVIKQDMVKANLTTLTADQLTALANAVADDTAKTAIPLTNTVNTTTWTATVSAGTYLVLVSNTEAHSYNPLVVSAYYVNKDGKTDISEGVVDLTTTVANAKKSDAPTIDKKITNSNGNDYGNSVEVDDIVNYEVTVTPIPSYTGSYPVFNVEDTLSTGLDFVTDENGNVVDPVVKVGNKTLAKDTDYTVSVVGRTMTINFVKDNAYKLNEYASQTLTITYSAKVNKNAVLWQDVNTNTAKLNYTNDSKKVVEGNNPSAQKTTYTYTFDIGGKATGTDGIITKTGKNKNSETPLDGALFGLYKAGTNVTVETVATATEADAYKTATSDVHGQINFRQLKKGTYYLKELTAPNGYSVNTHVYTVIIDTTHKPDGTLASWSVTIDNNKTSTFTLNNEGTWESQKNQTYIVNTTLSSLPSTGGIGTTIFTIAGCVIMIAAAGLFFASRKKSNK